MHVLHSAVAREATGANHRRFKQKSKPLPDELPALLLGICLIGHLVNNPRFTSPVAIRSEISLRQSNRSSEQLSLENKCASRPPRKS